MITFRTCGPPGCMIAAIAMVTACSVTDYRQPVADFAQATRNANEALVQLNKQAADAEALRLRDLALQDGTQVKFAEENGQLDCRPDSKRCRFLVVASQGESNLLPPDPPLKFIPVLARSIDQYAQNLTAIVASDTAEKVKGNVSTALANIQKLAETKHASNPSKAEQKPAVPQFATPVGEAVNWLFGQYIASVQLSGLRHATQQAKPVIAEAADLFQAAADKASHVRQAAMQKQINTRHLAFVTDRGEHNLDMLLKVAAEEDLLFQGRPGEVFAKLKNAHNALADRLQGENMTFEDVVRVINQFAAEAEELVNITRSLEALNTQKAEK